MTGRRTSSVKTLTDSSGEGDGDGDAGGFAGCCEVCAAATAKKAATTRSPIVRLRLNISGIREIGCLAEACVALYKPQIYADDADQSAFISVNLRPRFL